MSVRLIAGRAGSGKTYTCLMQIAEELSSAPAEGPRLVLLVPEQAALQMERALLTVAGLPALGRCEVLSFRRLARRILQELGLPGLVTLSPLARQMALRHLIGRRARQLREFGAVAQRSGFVASLATTVVELMQEAVRLDDLDAAARAAAETDDPSALRLHDLALLHRAYLEYLGSQRVDPEGVLDLARARLDQLAWPAGARIWINGFAGLTRQQMRMTVELARRAAAVHVSLLIDPADRAALTADAPPDDWSLFARTQRTWFDLVRVLIEAGVAIDEPLRMDGRPRFRCAELANIERGFLTTWRTRKPSSDGPEHHHDDDSSSATEGGRYGHDASSVEEGGRYGGGSAPTSAVRLIKARDRRIEVEAAANALLDLVQRTEQPLRWRDVAIVVRNLEPYHDLVSAALAERGIPFFTDQRRPTHHHPLVETVRATLAMHGGSRAFGTAVAMLLKTGLSGLGDVEADSLENYLLAHGLYPAESWAAPWKYPVDADKEPGEPVSPGDAAALGRINGSRLHLLARIGPWRPIAGAEATRDVAAGIAADANLAGGNRPNEGRAVNAQPVRAWIEGLCRLLERFDVRTQLARASADAHRRGDLDEAEEHEQVWTDLMRLFDETVAALGEESMSARQIRDVIESALEEFTLGLVPPTLDQVLVGSIERSRHPPVKAVFLLGFGDGQFPARVSEDAVLGDDERAVLSRSGVQLARTQTRRMLDERMLAYIALTRASERLWVSYPAADERGRPLGPSPYWEALRAVVPEAAVEEIDIGGLDTVGTASQLGGGIGATMRAVAEQRLVIEQATPWLAAYEWARVVPSIQPVVVRALGALGRAPEANLTDSARKSLWPPPYKTSVTRLEQFAQCPFQHYAMQGLRLRPRAEHEISAIHLGRLYHAVLEQFTNELIDQAQTLKETEVPDIAASLARLTKANVDRFAETMRLDDSQSRDAIRRGEFELPIAYQGGRSYLDKTKLRPKMTERAFGGGKQADLPALLLKVSDDCDVLVRGKIDRVDLLSTGDHDLAVVFDYKRKLSQRLRLDEVYHGLALQLLTYLLVLRDGEVRAEGRRIVPGGAFYLPLLGSFVTVDHPDDTKKKGFDPFAAFRPRGVLDFDWIDVLDPTLQGEAGKSSVFLAQRKTRTTKDEAKGLSDLGMSTDRMDYPVGRYRALLDHVRMSMTELARRWLAGDISVQPTRLGHDIPCTHCAFKGVCRVEYLSRTTRTLAVMSRSQVIEKLVGELRAETRATAPLIRIAFHKKT